MWDPHGVVQSELGKTSLPPHRPSLRTQAPAPSPQVHGSCVYVGWGGILTGTSPPNCTPGSTGAAVCTLKTRF